MALGTSSMLVAVESGEAASELVRSTSAVRAVLQQHQDLAETTEVLFTLLTVVLAALLYAPKLLRRELGLRVVMALLAAFLLFYITGALFLVKTAHQGARLVHEFGVKAPVASSITTTDVASSPTPEDKASRSRVGPETGFIGQARKRHPSGGTQSPHVAPYRLARPGPASTLQSSNEAKEV